MLPWKTAGAALLALVVVGLFLTLRPARRPSSAPPVTIVPPTPAAVTNPAGAQPMPTPAQPSEQVRRMAQQMAAATEPKRAQTLLAELRERRAAAAPPTGPALGEQLDRFFAVGPLEPPPAGPPTPSDALLDQLPEFPVSVRGHRLADVLRPAYRALAAEPK